MQLHSLADIARLVRNQRAKLNLSQADAAALPGASRQLTGRNERGNGGTSIETFMKISSALDIALEGHANDGQQEMLSGFSDALDRWLLNDLTPPESTNE